MAQSWVKLEFHPQIARKILRYGFPLIPTNLAFYVLLVSDRVMLNLFLTLEAVAIYAFAYKVAAIFDVLIIRPFAIDWAARRFKIAAAPDASLKYGQITLLFLCVAVCTALSLWAIAPVAFHLLAPPVYGDGLRVLPLILLAYLLYGLSYPLNTGIMLKDKTHYLPVIGIFSAVVSLGLNYYLIPIYGLFGAAISTVVAYGCWTALIAILSQKYFRVTFPARPISLVFVAALLVAVSFVYVDTNNFSTIASVASKLALLTLAMLIGITKLSLFSTNTV